MDKFKSLIASTIPRDTSVLGENNVPQEDICLTNFHSLKRLITADDLMNTEFIMFRTISYFAEVEGTLNKSYLFDYLDSSIDSFIAHRNVNVNEMLTSIDHKFDMTVAGEYNQAKIEIMRVIRDYYDSLTELPFLSKSEFKSMLRLYADELYEANYLALMRKSTIIVTKGSTEWIDGRKRELRGVEDSEEFLFRNIALLRSKYKINDFGTISTAGDVAQLEQINKMNKALHETVSDTGIAPIDDALRGFRRTQLLGVEAGAGVGKSRFSRWIAYRAATMYGMNVYDITMEQEHTEIWWMYVSIHLKVKYNVEIPDSEIKTGSYPEELAHYVQIAQYDLMTNEKYGRIRVDARDMYIEDTFELLTGIHKSEFRYDMLVMDYASLVDSRAKNKYGGNDAYDVVTQVYKRSKRDICRKLKVFTLIINQLKESGVKALAKGENTTTYDASNSGETYKSTDANLVLSSNEQLDAEGKMRITSPKMRSAKKFYNVYVKANIGCSVFTYESTEELTEQQYVQTLEDAV